MTNTNTNGASNTVETKQTPEVLQTPEVTKGNTDAIIKAIDANKAAKLKTEAEKPAEGTYTLVKGDTLSIIAEKLNLASV
jgi:LysM repeat protein